MRKPIRYGGPETRDREATRSRKAMSRQIDDLRAENERLRAARDRLVQLAGAWRVKAAGQSHSHTGQSFAAAIEVCADELLEAVGHMRPEVARLRRVADAAARVASVGYACCCPRETPCERCTDRRELRAALDALTAR